MDIVTPNQPVAVTLNADTDDAVGIFLQPGEVWLADADVVLAFPQFFEEVEVKGKRGPGRPKKAAAKKSAAKKAD